MNAFLIILCLFSLVFSPLIVLLPAIIGRNKKNCRAILALNFFGGWTVIGWIIALVWACTQDSEEDERRAKPLAIGTVLVIMYLLNAAWVAIYVNMITLAQKQAEVAEVAKQKAHEELVQSIAMAEPPAVREAARAAASKLYKDRLSIFCKGVDSMIESGDDFDKPLAKFNAALSRSPAMMSAPAARIPTDNILRAYADFWTFTKRARFFVAAKGNSAFGNGNSSEKSGIERDWETRKTALHKVVQANIHSLDQPALSSLELSPDDPLSSIISIIADAQSQAK
ncbi:MAG: superinfection immunity protein [Chthoniobacterales bacterium]